MHPIGEIITVIACTVAIAFSAAVVYWIIVITRK